MEQVLEHYPQFQGIVSWVIPDPHVERWMLVDPAAFKQVFGRGCTLPAPLGGLEFVEEIVSAMDLGYAETHETSLGLFLKDLKAFFNSSGRF